jgi:hypothetical protein
VPRRREFDRVLERCSWPAAATIAGFWCRALPGRVSTPVMPDLRRPGDDGNGWRARGCLTWRERPHRGASHFRLNLPITCQLLRDTRKYIGLKFNGTHTLHRPVIEEVAG